MSMTSGPEAGVSGRAFSVFLSYRREDTGQSVEHIQQTLEAAFGENSVYLDTKQPPGTEWLSVLKERGRQASALLFLIGPRWVEEIQRRAGQTDYVRKEIMWALHDWPGRVILLHVGTPLPDVATLPRWLRGLMTFKAFEIRIGSITDDLSVLIKHLKAAAAEGNPVRSFDAIPVGARTPLDRILNEPENPHGVPAPTEGQYRQVIADMAEGRLVPVLGCRAHGAAPECEALAHGLAGKYHDVGPDSAHLAEVAQRVWVMRDDIGLDKAMHDLLEPEPKPGEVDYFLARFPRLMSDLGEVPPYQLIITTSYGRTLESAFDEMFEPYDLLVYLPGVGQGQYVLFPWGEDAAGPEVKPITVDDETPIGITDDGELARTMIVKLHGTAAGHQGELKWSDKYIVTEDHYIDYAPGNLPKRVIEKLTMSRCLFLGYHLGDWNSRVLLRRAWPGRPNPAWAIDHAPDAVEAASWQKLGSTTLLSQSPTAFIRKVESMLAAPPDADAVAVGAD